MWKLVLVFNSNVQQQDIGGAFIPLLLVASWAGSWGVFDVLGLVPGSCARGKFAKVLVG